MIIQFFGARALYGLRGRQTTAQHRNAQFVLGPVRRDFAREDPIKPKHFEMAPAKRNFGTMLDLVAKGSQAIHPNRTIKQFRAALASIGGC